MILRRVLPDRNAYAGLGAFQNDRTTRSRRPACPRRRGRDDGLDAHRGHAGGPRLQGRRPRLARWRRRSNWSTPPRSTARSWTRTWAASRSSSPTSCGPRARPSPSPRLRDAGLREADHPVRRSCRSRSAKATSPASWANCALPRRLEALLDQARQHLGGRHRIVAQAHAAGVVDGVGCRPWRQQMPSSPTPLIPIGLALSSASSRKMASRSTMSA